MENIIENDLKINYFYTIISGIFKYSKNSLIKGGLPKAFCNWKHRINNGDYKKTFEHLDKNYYDSYIINMYPEIKQENDIFKTTIFLNHLTKTDLIEAPLPFSINISGKEIKGIIHFIDVFLFPNEIGIFSIKFEITDKKQLTIENVSVFTKKIRQSDTVICITDKDL